MTAVDRLFVYGTLRIGQPAHALVGANIARSEPATAQGVLYALPMGYPGFVAGHGVVVGDVLWLTDAAATLRRLDVYEGDEYTRIACPVALQSGPEITAWCYTLTSSAAITSGSLIEGGDWVRYRANASSNQT